MEAVAEEAIVRAVNSEAVERAVARALDGPALDDAVKRALESPAVEQAWARLLVGTVLAAIPLGLGFIGVLLGERRRGLQNVIAGTEVL